MKKLIYQIIIFLLLLCGWIGLWWGYRFVNQMVQEQTRSAAGDVVSVLSGSVRESLSQRLDYNREAMQEFYLQETWVKLIRPVSFLEGGYAWVSSGDLVYLGNQTNGAVQVEVMRPITEKQQKGYGYFSWINGEMLLQVWEPVYVNGYDWIVGVSIPPQIAWQKPFLILTGLYGALSVIVLVSLWLLGRKSNEK